jgi:octopine/nopaline transport system ATP-binding protein
VTKGSSGGQPAVVVEGLHKSFGDLEVLKGVSMTAHEGDVVSMIGASGSGKSTFLRCINFLEMPTQGRIQVTGEDISLKTGHDGNLHPTDRHQLERIRTRLGMVFQSFNLWPHLNVLENVIEAPVHVLKVPKAEAIERGEALLQKVGLYEKKTQYPAFLSGGQQQRAAIARALAMNPKVMLFDEPTSALDPELRAEVLDVMLQLAADGMTMIIVTHEMNFARKVANRAFFIDDGSIVEEGDPRVILRDPKTERLSRFLNMIFWGQD